MPINVAHPGLKALLEFEATKHQQSIEYEEVATFVFPRAFVPRIVVQAYSGQSHETLTLPMGDTTVTYTGPWKYQAGYGVHDIKVGDIHVGCVNRSTLFLFISLESLFDQHPASVANKFFDLVFSQAMPLLNEAIKDHDWTDEAAEYVRTKMSALDRSVRTWREELVRNEREIDEKTWQIASLVGRNERLREAMSGFEDITKAHLKRKAGEEHAELVRMLKAGSIRSLTMSGTTVDVETCPLEVEYDGHAFLLGPFHVALNLVDGTIRIVPVGNAPKADGYCHPHVASNGSPCLGNMAPVFARLLGAGDVLGAVATSLEFLRSYNHGNGYIDLRRWDPDWESDDDRFERCYEDASRHECAVCSDDGCPYRDGAERRCFDDTSFMDCIECADCRFHQDAINECRLRHEEQPWGCTDCTASCPHAGDLEACYDGHQGERCSACPNTECSKRENDNDQAADADPVADEGGAP